VRRLLAIAVAFVFVGVVGRASPLHTHAYSGHDHREHNHGPAAHAHAQAPAHHDEGDDSPHFDTCDPGQHAVPVTIGAAPLPHADSFHAESSNARIVARLVLVRSANTLTDVRVHGPPSLRHVPTRAPPPTFPA
jgi:hypothetical protein